MKLSTNRLIFQIQACAKRATRFTTRGVQTGGKMPAQTSSSNESEPPTKQLKNSGDLMCVTHISQVPNRAGDMQAGLVDTFLQLERIDKNLFLARHLLQPRKHFPAVYGGQVIGQALAAASATIDQPDLSPHSLHSFFLTTGNVDRPILYSVERIRDGRSFSNRLVKAIQDGETIFTTQISFHKSESSAIKHQDLMPTVPSPDTLEESRDLLEKASHDETLPPHARATAERRLVDIAPAFDRIFSFRPVDPRAFTLGDPDSKAHSYVWVRVKDNIGDDLRLHHAIGAYISDAFMIETALRPHVRDGFIPGMALTLDHCLWIHDPNVRTDDWILFETISPAARGGRAYITGRVWTRDGRLVMSTSQEGLIRARRDSTPKKVVPQ